MIVGDDELVQRLPVHTRFAFGAFKVVDKGRWGGEQFLAVRSHRAGDRSLWRMFRLFM